VIDVFRRTRLSQRIQKLVCVNYQRKPWADNTASAASIPSSSSQRIRVHGLLDAGTAKEVEENVPV
jgi:hypothetical protein